MADMEYKNGALHINKLNIDGNEYATIDDPENRYEMLVDASSRIISYRESDGSLVENAGIKTSRLVFTGEGMTEFQQALKDSGYEPGGKSDWSDYISNDGDVPLILSMPQCALVNIIDPEKFDYKNISKKGYNKYATQGVNYDRPVTLEFWDMHGNYFKKPILISGQGNDSMNKDKKNFSIDLFDTSQYNSKGKLGKGDTFTIKFDDWVPQDSFHLKAYWYDYYHAKGAITYKIYNSMVKSHGIMNDYVWKRALIDFSNISATSSGISNMDEVELQFDSGARCFPDGFPCVLFINDEFWGVYAWQLKKHRDNYHMDKADADQLHIDQSTYQIWLMNGNVDWRVIFGKKTDDNGSTHGIEIRNPKDLYVVDVTYSYVALDPIIDAEEIEIMSKQLWGYGTCTDDASQYTDTYIRETYGCNIQTYLYNQDTNIWYRIVETPTGTCSKYDADVNNHEFIDDTMECYNPENKDHKRTNKVKNNLVKMSRILSTIEEAEQAYLDSSRTETDLRAFKDVFETYFDVQNLIDYRIFSDFINNYEGWGWNWQVISYDSTKWYLMPYDLDLCFTGNINYTHQNENYLMFKWLHYYNSEMEEQYAYYRDHKILDSDIIVEMFRQWMLSVGKPYYMMEYNKWTSSGSNRFDSLYRLKKWIDMSLSHNDITYNYNKN